MAPGSGSWKAVTMDNAQYPGSTSTDPGEQPRRLCRPEQDRMLAGVASGIARFLGIDVLVVRIAIVVLCFVGAVGLPLYLAGWLLIPEQGAEKSVAAEFLDSIQSKR